MKKFRVLFYRPDIDHRPLDNAISGWTLFWNTLGHPMDAKLLWLLRASHCEIWIPDEGGFFTWSSDDTPEVVQFGTCYTATRGQAGGDNKVRENGSVKRPAEEILTTPRRWFYFEFEVCDEAFKKMVDWMELQVANNQGYDKVDIVKFFLPYRTQDPDDNKKICSGFAWVALFKVMCQQVARMETGKHATETELIFRQLLKKHNEWDLFSPLLMAFNQVKAEAKAVDLETGIQIK